MIKNLIVNNFTLFKKASFDFGACLNVISGENGTGKTQLLKLLYTLTSCGYNIAETQKGNSNVNDKIFEFLKEAFKRNFRTDVENLSFSCRKTNSLSYDFCFGTENKKIHFKHTWKEGICSSTIENSTDDCACIVSHPVFLQARELLSIYPNFLSLFDRYQLPYDGTFRDTISTLGLPDLKDIPKNYAKLIHELEDAIGGTIQLDANKNSFF